MQVCYNGQFFAASTPIFNAGNRGFKYGDAVFETARVANGKLLLADAHFGRLLNGLQLLQISFPPSFIEAIHQHVIELCRLNGCATSARVRLAVFRGQSDEAKFIIEAKEIAPRSTVLPAEGWTLGVYHNALKACDSFSNLKSANYLPYLMAQRYAVAEILDECLVLNSRKTIADGAKTNLFALIDGVVYTPPLSAGGVAGVMRRHVINRLAELGSVVKEEDLQVASLGQASEVFVTNAIEGIRWIKRFGTAAYNRDWITKMSPSLLEGI